jgi:uncharacterized LabA/DUF88 family protein
MNQQQIKGFLDNLARNKDRNIVLVDFANVDRWQESLGWPVGVNKLGQLVKHMSKGKKFLRRFYYGLDYGPKDASNQLTDWSNRIHTQANFSGFKVITKRVKYIRDSNYATGFTKKCNLDIEMSVDLITEEKNYDTAIIFSGDGDLAYVIEYIHMVLGKKVYVFGARDHIGKELMEAKSNGVVRDIFFTEDFEYRLNLRRKTI